MPVTLAAIGSVEPSSTVAVRAQVTGTLTAVNFVEGQDVLKGEVLFEIDPRPFDIALEQARAALARDKAQLDNAQTQVTRYQDLYSRGLVPHEQFDQVSTTAATLAAAVQVDQAQVRSAELQREYAVIRAPIDGRTGALLVHPGNLVRATDTSPLVVINQIAPAYVSFTVPQDRLDEVVRARRAGSLRATAVVPGDGSTTQSGQVSFVDNGVDPATGTIRLKATFLNADRRLWPGRFVTVTLTLQVEPSAVVAPAQAVQTGQQGTYVFVVRPDDTVESRTVDVARTVGADAVIARGVAPGERVVTDGQLRLVPGARVRPTTAADPVQAP
jgi:multidrug efflux system membrane fusion protein